MRWKIKEQVVQLCLLGGGGGGFKICEAIEDMQMNISGNPLREIQQLPQKQYKY